MEKGTKRYRLWGQDESIRQCGGLCPLPMGFSLILEAGMTLAGQEAC